MTNTTLYDVAIIGGGLAGLTLAIQCARENYKVILFEKENYPFHRVCGEYISLESYNFLQQLGLDLHSMALPVIKKLELTDSKGRSYSFDLPLGGFGISRFSLDYSLYQIALAKGVEVLVNTKVNDVSFEDGVFTVEAGDKTMQAKTVAGAYGKRSNLDIKWKRPFVSQKSKGLDNYIGIKYHIRYDHNPLNISLHNFHGGYCGMSAIEDGKSCLCYLTTAQNLKDSGNSIKEMQQKILFKNPRIKEVFSSADFLFEEPLAISQISFSQKSVVQNHLLMLGDSAGMISPLCGNGMSMAMHAAKIAQGCIKSFLNGNFSREQMEKEYQTKCTDEFSTRLRLGRTIQRFFGGDSSTSLFLKTMSTLPPVAKMIIRSTHGNPF